MQQSRTLIAVGLMTGYCPGVTAHHSFVGFYDLTKIEEIEGRVRSTSWRNPHGSMIIEVASPDGTSSTGRANHSRSTCTGVKSRCSSR